LSDPSEMRTDVTGKVVRYIQEPGTMVNIGEPYVEVEAMKMIMPLKATETGKITPALSPGSVVNAGDLLASLELKDPSKVKKIEIFVGSLGIENVDLEASASEKATHLLAGFKHDPDAIAQSVLAEIEDAASAVEFIDNSIKEFLRIENIFDGKVKDEVVRELTKSNVDSLGDVVEIALAYQETNMREKFISALLRQVDTFQGRYGPSALPDSFVETLGDVVSLEGKAYGELKLLASDIIIQSKVPPFEERLAELRKSCAEGAVAATMAKSSTISSGVDLLCGLFKDSDATVRKSAIAIYIHRVYRAHKILSLDIAEIDGRTTCTWTFQFVTADLANSPIRQGILSVVDSSDNLEAEFGKIVDDASAKFDNNMPMVTSSGEPMNMMHVVAASPGSPSIASLEATVSKYNSQLTALGIRTVNVLDPLEQRDPKYYTFPQTGGYKEDPLRRNMRPTIYSILELSRLTANYELERLEAVGKNTQVYIATEKTDKKPVRGGPPQVVFVRGLSHTPGLISLKGAQSALVQGMDELERAQSNSKVSPISSSRIFLHSLLEIEGVTPEELASNFQSIMGTLKSRLAQRMLKLRVDEVEVICRLASTDADGNDTVQPVRLIASSMEGEWLKTVAYTDNPNPISGVATEFCIIGDPENKMCVLDPYGSSNRVQTKRAIARRVGSTYAYDFLGLLEVGLINEWNDHIKSMGGTANAIPSNVFSSQEVLLKADGEVELGYRAIGTNDVGMVAWQVNMKTPEYPEGREVVFVANDVTVQSGSFGVDEDDFYFKASEFARNKKIPRVYIACNAGARIGLFDELKPYINMKFTDEENPTKGFEYLYVTDEDYKRFPEGAIIANKVAEGWAITDIIGTNTGIGVENLRGSGMIAGETSRAYSEIFTLSYVTGRSVGIGAYLVRLGQRIIQMKQGPMILTGYSALNKLLGREVYNSQDQLGGPQVMVPNGVTHEEVEDDQAGVASILKWLSFVPKSVGALPAMRDCADPVSRDVEFRPTKTPYDPRMMLAGSGDQSGFFDTGSFKEYLAGWGKSVVVGRGRLGGIPMGAIAVETRLVDKIVPADPADPKSREAILPQAGQVLYPDSSYKTAQAIRDFDKEGLPLMLFANWRGFSGGSRDMSGEILKFGAMIVDALREYSNPVFVYLPPNGELRGGSWVVVDPTINSEKMEMYADPDSRGGILEPSGIIEVKFRKPDILKAMHRLDDQLKMFDSELDNVDFDEDVPALKSQIKAREDLLYPVYTQMATEFADAHDKTGRMKAKGVIKEAVDWSRSREFFYYLAKRRILQDDIVDNLKAANSDLDTEAALSIVKEICSADWEDNQAVMEYYTAEAGTIESKIAEVKKEAMQKKIEALQAELGSM
jgi:acetyl-CoA carboxylase/biotin carboxylase 1